MERVVGLWTEVWLDGSEISAKIDPCLLSLEYEDSFEGQTPDSITVKLEDASRLFQGDFYPKQGAALRFEFGFDTPDKKTTFKSAIGFKVNEISIEGAPDTVKWKAIGQLPGKAIHNRISQAWENTSLEDIAASITKQHGMKLVFEASQPIPLGRVDQVAESDMRLLRRLTEQYGLVLSFKGGKDNLTAVITDFDTAMKRPPIFEIPRDSVASFAFKDMYREGTGGATTQYFDADNKKLVTEEAGGADAAGHKIRTVAAKEAAGAHLHGLVNSAATFASDCSLTLPGNPRLLSGVIVSLSNDDWLQMHGDWLVIKSKHTLDVAAGYKTTITIRRKK